MHCRSCNTRVGAGDRTCPNCGIALNRPSAGARGQQARPGRKPALSPSTAIDPVDSMDGVDEVELDQVSEVEPAAASGSARHRGASPPSTSPRKGRTGGGFRPEPADVRRMLGERPDLLEAGLRAYTDNQGAKVGASYASDVGEIDLLATDDAGGLVVVMVSDHGEEKDLVADMLQRIGWVRKHLASRSQEVRGVVLIEPQAQDLSYAAAAVAGTVDFKTYRIALSFDAIEL